LFISLENNKFTIFQLIPHKNLKNYNNEKLFNGFSDYGYRFFKRVKYENKKILISNLEFIDFKMYLTNKNISFFISCSTNMRDYVKSKIESSWDHVTVKELECYPFSIDEKKTIISEMIYKKHDIFSLRIDKDITFPLRSIFNIVNEFNDTDSALINIFSIPYKRRHFWDYEAKQAYNKLKNGIMPRKLNNVNNDFGRYVGMGIIGGFQLIDGLLKEVSDSKNRKNKSILDNEAHILMTQGLSNGTLKKINGEVLQTWIRLLVQSDNIDRAKNLNMAISGTYRELATIENELENIIVDNSKIRIDNILNNRIGLVSKNSNKVSIYELSKLSMIPTAELQKDFKQIENVQRIETNLPDELFQDKGIPICKVTEKGITRIAKIPVYDHDVLCMPHLGFGMMRVGKSEGFGNNMAYHFIMNGFSSFLLETNDGLSLDALRDALPLDYPDEKIIEVDIGNLHWPIALSWNDSLSKSLNSNDEVENAKVAEKLTSHIIHFVNNLANENFSEKMSYYLNATKGVLAKPDKGLLDMLLTLTSPSYRKELMEEKYIQDQPEIYDALKTLQQKSLSNTDNSTIEPILTRLNILIGNKFLANLFLQPPKLRDGKPVLDFRKYMDNKEGGYGYCVLIRIPKAEFTSSVVNIIASFMISKIWTSALSRIDTKKEKRKPFVFVADEPHQYIKGSGSIYQEAGVESGKYRMKLVWLAHSLSQFGEFKSALTSGGAQYTAYKTKSFKEFKELENEFKEFDISELYQDLPKRWVAVNKIYLPKSDDVPSFIGDMLKPVKMVKDRSYRKLECSKEFGREFKEVVGYINKERDRRKADEEFMEEVKYEREMAKKGVKIGKVGGRRGKVIK